MKRTTLKIEDRLLRRLKQQAAREGRSLQDVANQLLRQGLVSERRHAFTLSLTGWEAELRPGVDLLDRTALLDLLDSR
jgi:plasmid stability protein